MDKDTRTAIQRATQSARALLEREVGQQLEGVYDIRLDGTIPAEPGAHLDETQRLAREKLIAAVSHHASLGQMRAEAIGEYLREAAFTTLNRFVALKMLEARELVQECVSRGDQSSGFREFCGLAPGLVQLPDQGYRLYLESLFDEIGQEVGILFDRRDPSSLIWPRRQALNELLEIINAKQLATVWGDDETIGWVYQYFNSSDERKQMRDESQAPRNSRELAVRNQFFTPRYVVRFLVDNTLARTWWQMRGGETRLTESCEFLVLDNAGDLVREKKDPRDIKILDPACGSGHFLLYAFDLLQTIYEEAWHDDTSPPWAGTGSALREDYPELGELYRALPGMILGNNLFGVEIDARAAQIAALALWLRAQRAYREHQVAASERPRITRTHIVVAEPMPGDGALVEAFASDLQPPLLGDLFKRMVSEMRLAGELGTLLRVDDAIATSVTQAREEYVRQATTPHLPGLEPDKGQEELDFSEIDDVRFFEEAEAMLLNALHRFSESAAGSGGVRRWLFADDAAQGIAFIELIQRRFDVVLMNPPFGQPIERTYDYVRSAYTGAHADIFAAFVRRARELSPDGLVGTITSRSFLLTPRLQQFREDDVVPGLVLLADLGLGVMDDAYVESAAYVLAHRAPAAFRALDCRAKSAVSQLRLRPSMFVDEGYVVRRDTISDLPQSKLLYSLPQDLVGKLSNLSPFEPTVGTAREGMKSFDNDRFIRLAWEVPATEIGRGKRWHWFAKGGSHAFLYAPIHLLLNWNRDGSELRAVNLSLNGSTAQVRQASAYWYRPGITYSKRSAKGFSGRCLPADVIFSSNGPAVLPNDEADIAALLGWINSRFIRGLMQLQSNFGDFSTGAIKGLPWQQLGGERAALESELLDAINEMIAMEATDETSPYFVAPYVGPLTAETLRNEGESHNEAATKRADAMAKWDSAVARAYGISDVSWIEDVLSPTDDEAPADDPDSESAEADDEAFLRPHPDPRRLAIDLLSWAVGVSLGRFDVRMARLQGGGRSAGPFDALPPCSPGILVGADRLPTSDLPPDYPLALSDCFFLVDDEGHERDIVACVRAVFDAVFEGDAEQRWYEALHSLDPQGAQMRSWFAKGFFDDHLKRYSRSRRKAPIFWQLGTPSGRYSVWIYAHRLTDDSLFQLQSDVLAQKLAYEERQLTNLVQSSGGSPSAKERREIEAQEALVEELRVLLEEVKRVAPLWKSTLDDGIVLVMAPLWRLVPHKSWQRELKKKWAELADGKYEWAQLAMLEFPRFRGQGLIRRLALQVSGGG